MRNQSFELNNFYHVYNRGVEKRDVFMDDEDRAMFVNHLYSLNNKHSHPNLSRNKDYMKIHREPIVKIHGFCLMNNHYHFLLEEIVENGISRFMQKIGTGYTMYFNKKYDRSGSLFQGKYKIKHINTDAHFNYILNYIHLNPHDEGRTFIIDELLRYKWSSLRAYILPEKSSFQSVVETDYFLNYFNGRDNYIKQLGKSANYQKDKFINADILMDVLD
jgi:putative transposase